MGQFEAKDRAAAAELLDATLLLNGEQVMSAQRSGLDELAAERHGMRGAPRRRAAKLWGQVLCLKAYAGNLKYLS